MQSMIVLDFLEPGQTISSDRYIAPLAKLKAIRPEKKTSSLLQQYSACPHASMKTMELVAKLARVSYPTCSIVRWGLLTSICLGNIFPTATFSSPPLVQQAGSWNCCVL
jgi:hypothetical protein